MTVACSLMAPSAMTGPTKLRGCLHQPYASRTLYPDIWSAQNSLAPRAWQVQAPLLFDWCAQFGHVHAVGVPNRWTVLGSSVESIGAPRTASADLTSTCIDSRGVCSDWSMDDARSILFWCVPVSVARIEIASLYCSCCGLALSASIYLRQLGLAVRFAKQICRFGLDAIVSTYSQTRKGCLPEPERSQARQYFRAS